MALAASCSPSSRSCCCRSRWWRSICSPSPPISTCRNFASRLNSAEPPRLDRAVAARRQCHAIRRPRSNRRSSSSTSTAARSSTRLDAALDLRRMFSPPRGRLVVAAAAAGHDRRAGAVLEGPGRPVLRPCQRHRRGAGARIRCPPRRCGWREAIVAACESWSTICRRAPRHDALRTCRGGARPGRRPAQVGSRRDPRLPRSRGADRSGADRGGERHARRPAARRAGPAPMPSCRP